MSNLLPSSLLSSSVDLPAPLDSTLNRSTHSSVLTPPRLHPGTGPDPFRAVLLLLLAASILGMVVEFVAAQMLGNPALFNVAITFGIAAGILIGIAVTRTMPATPPAVEAATPTSPARIGWRVHVTNVWVRIERRLREIGAIRIISLSTAAAGVFALGLDLVYSPGVSVPALLAAVIGAAINLATAGLAAAAAHYLQTVDSRLFPESPGLCRGSRVVAWILVVSAVSIGAASAGFYTVVQVFRYALIAVNFAACYGLFRATPINDEGVPAFPLEMDVLSILGSRPNIMASILDHAERQLGIDLRSTWALTVVRRSVEPLVIGLCLLAWLSTSLTVVGMEEQGLVERLGVPSEGNRSSRDFTCIGPGPWIGCFGFPCGEFRRPRSRPRRRGRRGPENVLWAVEHAPNEYTLLLGNGRDLITVDAAVQYRIADARAWRYHCQNPADALRAIAYRAVMRTTVNRTLSEALSENVVALTDAHARHGAAGCRCSRPWGRDRGVHGRRNAPAGARWRRITRQWFRPRLAKVTAVVNAQAYRNEIVPAAEASVLKGENTARAEGAEALAQAAGEAWSFRTLESQYRAAPKEYFFRRRLETLEKALAGAVSRSWIPASSGMEVSYG